jgi:hypothetical protein
MKKLLTTSLAAAAAFALVPSSHAQSWGFALGNGAGFFFGKQSCSTTYVAPAPVYRHVTVYQQPQTVYMQPYQQMRPVTYYQPTVVYRSEPVVIQRNHRRCHSGW